MDDTRLERRHVVVTGGARGIGRGIAERAACAGADVTIFDVDTDSIDAAVEAVTETGSQATAVEVDVANGDGVESGVAEAVETLGPIHGLVNNAGVQTQQPVLETSEADWNVHMEVNAKGTFLCSQHVGRHMVEEGIEGSIVNIASTAAEVRPRLGQGAYAASKGAVASLSIVVALELGDEGITCNVIKPGGVDTPMVRQLSDDIDETADQLPPEVHERASEMYPAGRIGRPADIGHMATLLLSDEAEWITGQAFVVDGGITRK